MTDDATPKKIRRRRPTKYPAQLAVMMTQELYDAIEEAATDPERSKGEVAREWMEAGRLARHEYSIGLGRDDADDAPVKPHRPVA